jgi:hypothetical protein
VSTSSTINLWRLVRTRILTFQPPTGDPLEDRLAGDGLFYAQAPDDEAYPYAVGRFLNRFTGGAWNGDRDQVDLELEWFHRPRKRAEALEDIVDVADMALLRWADGSSGLVFGRERFRDTQAARMPPADREVVMIWTKYPLVAWMNYLTQFSPFVGS